MPIDGNEAHMCYVGGALITAGHNVTLLGRKRLGDELSQYGMHITDWQGRKQRLKPEDIDYCLDEDILAQADYVLLTVKSGDTESAAKVLLNKLSASTCVISLQNGVQNVDKVRRFLPDNRVIRGMVPFNVFYKGKGHFHCGTEGNLAMEVTDKVVVPLIASLSDAGLPVDVYENLAGIQWSKLIMNLNNSVNALSGKPLVEQLNEKGYRRIMAKVIKEALNVTSAAGIKLERTGKVIPAVLPFILSLPTWLFKHIASTMLKIDPDARSSMYEDLQLGRATEVDYLNGEIVKLAQRLKESAPINESIVRMIKQAEQVKQGSPNLSAQSIEIRLSQ